MNCLKASLLAGPALASVATWFAVEGSEAKAPPAIADEGGTISGKVSFNGEAPKMAPISFDADPVCSQKNSGGRVLKEEVIVNSNQTLRNVLVYVKASSKAIADKKFDAPKTPVVLEQSSCQYKPHVFGMMAGQEIEIVNADPTSHNIKCQPKKNQNFNISQAKEGMKDRRSFDKEEIAIRLECNVHPWMNGYVGVFTHPFFAVTGEDGTYKITGLPAGEYEVVAWHESPRLDGQKTANATVAAGAAATVDFAFAPKAKAEK